MSTNNTYFTLADLKASPITEGTAFLVQDAAVKDGTFFWTLGDFSSLADDATIIKADGVSLADGAWVRDRIETPEDYGAVGDGIADDSGAFAKLTTAINARGYGRVTLVGRYKVQAAGLAGHVCRFENLSSIQISGSGVMLPAPLPAVWRNGTSASAVGFTVTVLDSGHTLQVNDEIILQGLSATSANGFAIVSAVTPGVSFSYIVAVAPGAITGTPQYANADYNRNILTFVDCDGVSVDATIQGEVRGVASMHRLGYRGVYCAGTCSNVAVTLRNSFGLSYGFVQGGALNQATIDVEGHDIGYAVSTFGTSYANIRVNVDTTSRGVFFTNGGNASIYCRAANFNSTAVLVSRTEDGYSENIAVDAPAAPQTAALTGNRTAGGEVVAVAAGGVFAGGFRNIRVRAGLRVTNTEGLSRIPLEFNMTNVTGRADAISIDLSTVRHEQTDVNQVQNEIIFKGPASCTFGNCSIVSVCDDPKTFDITTLKGFIVDIQASDGLISIDRRGGRTGYQLTIHPGANINWVNPPRPVSPAGLAFPTTTNKQVTWTAADIGTGDFTVWMRVSDLFGKSASRAMFYAGTSQTARQPLGADLTIGDSGNTVTFTIYGATLGDFTYRTFGTIQKYGITPGYNDIFAIRRSGVLELWVNGIKLVGTLSNGGTAPGEGGSLTTSYIVFNQTTNNAFAQELGASGFYSKALTAEDMRAVAAGGTIGDKSKILHQSDYRRARRIRYPNPYSSHTATIGSEVTLLDPADYYDVVSVIDPPSIAAGTIGTVTATVTGAVVGATVTASPRNALPAGVVQMNPGRVSAANTVAIDLFNSTGSPIDPPSNIWDVRVGR